MLKRSFYLKNAKMKVKDLEKVDFGYNFLSKLIRTMKSITTLKDIYERCNGFLKTCCKKASLSNSF